MKSHLPLTSASFVLFLCFAIAGCSGYAGTGVTEDIVKKTLTAREMKRPASNMTSDTNFVRIAFESIQFGKAHKANKAEEYDGIPAGAMIYPVRVKWITTRWWTECLAIPCTGDSAKRMEGDTKTYYDYGFYKDAYSEWATVGYGPVK